MADLESSSVYQEQLLEVQKQISSLNTEIEVKKKLLETPDTDPELLELTAREIKIAEYALTGARQREQEVMYLIGIAQKQESGEFPKPEAPPVENPAPPAGEKADGTVDLGKEEEKKEPEKPIDPETGGPEGEDCGCKEDDGSGDGDGSTSRDPKPDMLVPQLGMRGVFTYKPPFDKPEYKDLEVTVKALRLIKEVIDSEEDPFTNIYQLNGLDENIFSRDLKWKVPIIVFVTDDVKYFYVPATYLGSLPKLQTGVKYQQLIMGVNLGYLPVDYNFDLIKETIIENLKATSGIVSTIETLKASAVEIVTEAEHTKFLNTIKERTTDMNSPAVKLRFLQERFKLLQEQMAIYSKCFHFHVEKGLALLDEEKKKEMGYIPSDDDDDDNFKTPGKPGGKYQRTEQEYQKLLQRYYTVKFGYDSFVSRYNDLKRRHDILVEEKATLIEEKDDLQQEMEAKDLANKDEIRKRDRYYAIPHVFEEHLYMEDDEGNKLFGALQIHCQAKTELDPEIEDDTYGYVLGEYPVLCKDCIKHTYEFVDPINKAVMEAIDKQSTSIDVSMDNTKYKEIVEFNPGTMQDEVKKVIDPVPIEVELGWDYGIKSIDTDIANSTREDYIQPGHTGQFTHVWFGTTRLDKFQYCQHIPKEFYGKQIQFDPYAIVQEPTPVDTKAREYMPWTINVSKTYKPTKELLEQVDKIFDSILKACNDNLLKSRVKLETVDGYANYVFTNEKKEKTNFTDYDDRYWGTGVARRVDGDRNNAAARTTVAAIRLTTWDKDHKERLCRAAALYFKKEYNIPEPKEEKPKNDKPKDQKVDTENTTPKQEPVIPEGVELLTWIDVVKYLYVRVTTLMTDYLKGYLSKNLDMGINPDEYYLDKQAYPTAYFNKYGYGQESYPATVEFWNLALLNNLYYPVYKGLETDIDNFTSISITSKVNSGSEQRPIPTMLVKFNANGGTGKMEDAQAHLPEGSVTYVIPEPTFTPPTNKEFEAWSEDSSGTKVKMPNEEVTFTKTGTYTLYALWKWLPKPKRTIVFEANGGDGTMDDVVVELPYTGEVKWTVVPPTFTPKQDFRFKTWAEDANGDKVKEVGSEVTFTEQGTYRLYAIWEEVKNIIIRFDPNGGEGTMEEVELEIPKGETSITYEIPTSTFTAPEKKLFKGWSEEADGTNTKYAGDQMKFTKSGIVTLYAVWTVDAKKVTREKIEKAYEYFWTISYGSNQMHNLDNKGTAHKEGGMVFFRHNRWAHAMLCKECATKTMPVGRYGMLTAVQAIYKWIQANFTGNIYWYLHNSINGTKVANEILADIPVVLPFNSAWIGTPHRIDGVCEHMRDTPYPHIDVAKAKELYETMWPKDLTEEELGLK